MRTPGTGASGYPAPCLECGKPATGKRCAECFAKIAGQSIGKMKASVCNRCNHRFVYVFNGGFRKVCDKCRTWDIKGDKKLRPPRASGRPVYFIKADESPLIKIGVSSAPTRRVRDMQSGCPVRLRILATTRGGGQRLESSLHKQFADSREHGEWFRATPVLLSLISEICGEVETVDPTATTLATTQLQLFENTRKTGGCLDWRCE